MSMTEPSTTELSVPFLSSKIMALGCAFLGGILVTLTVAPFGFWPLGFPGVTLLYISLVGTSLRQRFVRTLVWGTGLYVPSLWWLTAFSLPGGILVGLLEATITALTIALLGQTRSPKSTVFSMICTLVIADALRSLWPLGGLPLGGIDLGQAAGPLASIVTLGGRLALIGVVALGGSALGLTFVSRNWRLPLSLITGLLFITGASRLFTTQVVGEFSIALIQGGGPRGLLASQGNAQRTWEAHLAATATLDQPVDMIMWPENTVDVDQLIGSDKEAVLMKIARDQKAWLGVGITENAPNNSFTNAQILISPQGELVDRFDKVRRVPFGEYFPLRSTIEGLGLADLPNRDAVAGKGPGILRSDVATMAILISYEGFFDDRARVGVRAGGEVVIIPTNSSSYKTSQLPTQQVAAARLRALETRRTVLQVGPTGITAEIDPNGRVKTASTIGVRDVTVTTVNRRTGLTPYIRFNDMPALAVAALCLVFAHKRGRDGA